MDTENQNSGQENTPETTLEQPETDNVVYDDGEQTPTNSEEVPPSDGGENTAPINQEAVNKAINKKHRKMMEAREASVKLEAKNAELQRQLDKHTAPVEPVVPEMPGAFDPDFDQKVATRDTAIRQHEAYNTQQNITQQQQQVQQQQIQQQQQVQQQQSMKKYQDRVTQLGLKEDAMIQAERDVSMYIQDQNIRNYLMLDEQGPLMVSYLAQNPTVLDQVSQMSTIEAGIHLANVVSKEALKLKPQQSTTPDPVEVMGGKSKVSSEDPYLKGAIFE